MIRQAIDLASFPRGHGPCGIAAAKRGTEEERRWLTDHRLAMGRMLGAMMSRLRPRRDGRDHHGAGRRRRDGTPPAAAPRALWGSGRAPGWPDDVTPRASDGAGYGVVVEILATDGESALEESAAPSEPVALSGAPRI
jgi:hypothetical protein